MTPTVSIDRLLVRPATEEDWPAIGARLEAFIDVHYTGLLPQRPDAQHALVEALIDIGGLWVLVDEAEVVGFIGIVVVPLPSTGELAGIECAWWVDPPYRLGAVALELLRRAETWAVAQGATVLHLTQPAIGADRLVTLYRRLGYQVLETTWQKRVG